MRYRGLPKYFKFAQIPGVILSSVARGQAFIRQCNNSPDMKRGLLLVLEPLINRNEWLSYNCEQLLLMIPASEQSHLRRILQKTSEHERLSNFINLTNDSSRRNLLQERLR